MHVDPDPTGVDELLVLHGFTHCDGAIEVPGAGGSGSVGKGQYWKNWLAAPLDTVFAASKDYQGIQS
jgi:hypothetical protein